MRKVARKFLREILRVFVQQGVSGLGKGQQGSLIGKILGVISKRVVIDGVHNWPGIQSEIFAEKKLAPQRGRVLIGKFIYPAVQGYAVPDACGILLQCQFALYMVGDHVAGKYILISERKERMGEVIHTAKLRYYEFACLRHFCPVAQNPAAWPLVL